MELHTALPGSREPYVMFIRANHPDDAQCWLTHLQVSKLCAITAALHTVPVCVVHKLRTALSGTSEQMVLLIMANLLHIADCWHTIYIR